ncbi:MAG TPA: hypothetical protein PKD83_00865 [Ignavibacteria bacterium]|nr:hypothetical protein [Ignavibacteria bacterium]
MQDSKIIEILKTFSTEEFKDFEKFIVSPYFRKRDITGLFAVLKPFYPDFNDKKLTVEYIFKKLFPGKKYERDKADSHLRTLTSDLFLSCKEFLIHLEINVQYSFRESFLLAQLRKRNLDKEFLKEAAIVNKIPLTANRELIFGFLEKSYISAAELEFFIDKSDFENAFERLIKQSEYIAAAAIVRGLKFIDQKIIAEDGYNLKTRYNFVENFIKHLNVKSMIKEMKENDDSFTPFIEIYYTVYQTLIHPFTESNFYELKNLLLIHNDILPQSDKYMLYSISTAFCDRMINDKGNLEFKKESFEIYSSMIKLGVYKYTSHDYFQLSLFRAMLISARNNKQYEWMKDLIDNYSKELHPDHSENMKYYSLGQYYYAIDEFGKALESLVRLKPDYFLYKKDLKNLMFRIYYNLGYFEEAFSVLDNLKRYLSTTNDLSEKIRDVSLKFAKYASELIKLKTGSKKDGLDYLIKKLNNEKNTESYDWLIEKAEELRSAKK